MFLGIGRVRGVWNQIAQFILVGLNATFNMKLPRLKPSNCPSRSPGPGVGAGAKCQVLEYKVAKLQSANVLKCLKMFKV